jgi:dienelactone hydrolase
MKIAIRCLLLTVLLCGTVAAEPQKKAAGDDLASRAGQFVQLLAEGDFPAAVKPFDATMSGALPEEKLKQTWESVIAQAGGLKSRLNTRSERVGEYDVVLVTCQFEKTKLDVKVVFNHAKQISGLFFVPTRSAEYQLPPYARPSAFQERDVQVGTGQWALPGTLALPRGDGPFPAVVLVHGSGPNDRDETIGPNKPFRDLAGGLASRGIAVLRYEKRTKHYWSRMAPAAETITVKEETIDDAVAAVETLAAQEKIDAKRVFVLGHSLGGSLLPRIGKAKEGIAGFISLAGSTRPLEDLILDQSRYILSLDGKLSLEAQKKLTEIEQQVANVKSANLSADTRNSKLPLGCPAKYWLDLRGYHPAEAAKGLSKPMLILQGGRDYQVTLEDFQGWKNTLSARQDVQFKLYPKLNHLFQAGAGKSKPVEYENPGHVAAVVIGDVATWIGQH